MLNFVSLPVISLYKTLFSAFRYKDLIKAEEKNNSSFPYFPTLSLSAGWGGVLMEIIFLAPGGLCCCVVALGMNCGSFQQIIKILNLFLFSPPPIQMGSDRLLMCNSFQVISLLFSRNITGTSNHLNKRDWNLYVFVSFVFFLLFFLGGFYLQLQLVSFKVSTTSTSTVRKNIWHYFDGPLRHSTNYK